MIPSFPFVSFLSVHVVLIAVILSGRSKVGLSASFRVTDNKLTMSVIITKRLE
jgi:hypothetical protein